jgi:hypothetical protein
VQDVHVQDMQVENTARWRAWRLACERGRDWSEAYDAFLHPDSRLPIEDIVADDAGRVSRRDTAAG